MSHLIALIFVLASAYIGSAFFSLLLGIFLAYCINLPDNFITKKIGSKFIQIGIILLAFSIPIYDAFEITKLFIPSIAVFVVSILLLGFIIGKFFNLKRNEIVLITSGTAICGATAIAAIAPIVKASPKSLVMSISLVFLFNAFALIAFPLIGNYFGMSQDFFGAWIALSIHDTASVLGAALSFGNESVDMATTIKLTRTLWLIPLMIALSIFYDRKTSFKMPIFVLIFLSVLFLNSYLFIDATTLLFIDNVSNLFLFSGLFCIGTSINKQSMLSLNYRVIFHALTLWVIAILLSYILVSYVL
jgi:uncharacterized integral membrane protein (TIGR00698 family)